MDRRRGGRDRWREEQYHPSVYEDAKTMLNPIATTRIHDHLGRGPSRAEGRQRRWRASEEQGYVCRSGSVWRRAESGRLAGWLYSATLQNNILEMLGEAGIER